MMVKRNEEEISSDSAEPPYVQLATILRRRIEAGEITAKVPSERDLHQEFGLAPVTIRKAVRMLRDEGLVRTVPGWGTYVMKKQLGAPPAGHVRRMAPGW